MRSYFAPDEVIRNIRETELRFRDDVPYMKMRLMCFDPDKLFLVRYGVDRQHESQIMNESIQETLENQLQDIIATTFPAASNSCDLMDMIDLQGVFAGCNGTELERMFQRSPRYSTEHTRVYGACFTEQLRETIVAGATDCLMKFKKSMWIGTGTEAEKQLISICHEFQSTPSLVKFFANVPT